MKKYIKAFLWLLSSLLLPYQPFGIALFLVPNIYINIIVPYFLLKTLFGRDALQIKAVSILWKIPIILVLIAGMLLGEFVCLVTTPSDMSLVLIIATFFFKILLLRTITYTMMIFIWQPNILKHGKTLAYLIVLAYCAFVGYALYAMKDAPDTDMPINAVSEGV